MTLSFCFTGVLGMCVMMRQFENEISISNRNDVKAMTTSSANQNFILKFEMFPPKGGVSYFVPARYNSLSVVRVPVAGS